jgi:hypothetical protein
VQLVAQDENLDLLRLVRAKPQRQQLEQTPQRPVEKKSATLHHPSDVGDSRGYAACGIRRDLVLARARETTKQS